VVGERTLTVLPPQDRQREARLVCNQRAFHLPEGRREGEGPGAEGEGNRRGALFCCSAAPGAF
jgi:hypothetical protein